MVDLAPLSGRHACDLADARLEYDVDRLTGLAGGLVAGALTPVFHDPGRTGDEAVLVRPSALR